MLLSALKKHKVYLNYILCRLGLRTILPRDIIKNVRVIESNDPFMDISGDDDLFFAEVLTPPVFLRRKAYKKLKDAKMLLPQDVYFKIYDAYRSIEDQRTSWTKRYTETKTQNPTASDEEVKRLTSLRIANPFGDGCGGHQTGGAIDITLCDNNGHDYNLGTKIPEHNSKTKTNSKDLTAEEKTNRKILFDAMTKAGYKNYPAEWWHFCYGDKMWAAYSWKNKCFYGYVDK